MVRSRPVRASVRPGQFISARYRDTKPSSIPAAVPSPVVALVAGCAAEADGTSSGCASAQPAVNQAAVETPLRSRDRRFIENAEGNGVWEEAGCIKIYVSLPSVKELGRGAGDLVACQEPSQVRPQPIA